MKIGVLVKVLLIAGIIFVIWASFYAPHFDNSTGVCRLIVAIIGMTVIALFRFIKRIIKDFCKYLSGKWKRAEGARTPPR